MNIIYRNSAFFHHSLPIHIFLLIKKGERPHCFPFYFWCAWIDFLVVSAFFIRFCSFCTLAFQMQSPQYLMTALYPFPFQNLRNSRWSHTSLFPFFPQCLQLHFIISFYGISFQSISYINPSSFLFEAIRCDLYSVWINKNLSSEIYSLIFLNMKSKVSWFFSPIDLFTFSSSTNFFPLITIKSLFISPFPGRRLEDRNLLDFQL